MATLLFAALLTVTGKPELASTHGFNTSGMLGTCSVLLFVVLLAHIQLREQFAGSSIVYMEYFYFLMYAVLVAVTANTYLFSMRAAPSATVQAPVSTFFEMVRSRRMTPPGMSIRLSALFNSGKERSIVTGSGCPTV